jgi:hypothetical protein
MSPSAKTQRYLGWIGAVGVLTACFACGLIANNQVNASVVFFIAAQAILVPLFLVLISTRRRIKRVVRSRDATRTAQRQAELDALGEAFGPDQAGVDLPEKSGEGDQTLKMADSEKEKGDK